MNKCDMSQNMDTVINDQLCSFADKFSRRANMMHNDSAARLNTPGMVVGIVPKGCRAGGILPYTKDPETGRRILLFNLDTIKSPKAGSTLQFGLNNEVFESKFVGDMIKMSSKYGLSDFGGGSKDSDGRSIFRTAIREMMEETGCIYYYFLCDQNMYNKLTASGKYYASDEDIIRLGDDIDIACDYFCNQYQNKKQYYMIHQEYCSHLLELPYIPSEHFPPHEDMHINYTHRYSRICCWLPISTILKLHPLAFHFRIRTPIQKWFCKNFVCTSGK